MFVVSIIACGKIGVCFLHFKLHSKNDAAAVWCGVFGARPSLLFFLLRCSRRRRSALLMMTTQAAWAPSVASQARQLRHDLGLRQSNGGVERARRLFSL